MFFFILLLISIHSYEQLYTLIYGNGNKSNEETIQDCYSYFTDHNNMPGRHFPSTFTNSDQSSYFFFAGRGYHCESQNYRTLNDLWEYRVVDGKWREVMEYTGTENIEMSGFHPENQPYGKIGQCSVERDGKYLIYGGRRGDVNSLEQEIAQTNEIWEFDPDLISFRKINNDRDEILNSHTIPNKDVFHSQLGPYKVSHMSCNTFNNDNSMLIYGGFLHNFEDGDNYWVYYRPYNTLYEYNILNDSFAWRTGNNISRYLGNFGEDYNSSYPIQPPATHQHTAWIMDNMLYYFGGVNEPSSSNYVTSLFSFNISSNQWDYLSGNDFLGRDDSDLFENKLDYFHDSNKPSTRIGSIGFNGMRDYLYISRGYGPYNWVYTGTFLCDDLWIYSISRNQFKLVNGTVNTHVNSTYGEIPKFGGRLGAVHLKLSESLVLMGYGITKPLPTDNLDYYYNKYQLFSDLWYFHIDRISDCSKRGELGEIGSNQTCLCVSSYYGEECELFNCTGYVFNDTNNACYGHGECVDIDECYCIEGWRHNSDCSIYTCNLIPYNNVSYVCSGYGDCIDVDDCNCTTTDQYGQNCEETIVDEASLIDYVLHISWIVFHDLIPEEMKDEYGFNCSLLFVNHLEIIDTLNCKWSYSNVEETSSLLVEDNYALFKTGDEIIVHPVTKVSEEITITIVYNSNDGNGGNGGNDIFNLSLTDYIIYGSIAAGIICFFLIILVVICCVICIQRKKIKKFNEIDDIDILLSEQNAAKKNAIDIKVKKSFCIINENEIKLLSVVGTGGSGCTVYRAKWNKISIAYKIMRNGVYGTSQTDYTEFEKEITLLCSLRHPNLLIFYGITVNAPRVGFVTEYCPNGSLESKIELLNLNNELMNLNEKVNILRQIGLGMEFLQGKSIIHRDLKCENVLFSQDFTIRIIDFGLSKVISDEYQENYTAHIGTSYYIAPEITVGSRKYNLKVDVFSFSMIMSALFLQKSNLFENVQGVEFKIAMNKEYRPEIPADLINCENEWYIELMKECWDDSAERRPNFTKIVQILSEHYKINQEESISKKESDDDVIESLRSTVSVLQNEIRELKQENNDLKNKMEHLQNENQYLKKKI